MTDARGGNLQTIISPRISIGEDELLIAKGIQRCLRTYHYSDTHLNYYACNENHNSDKIKIQDLMMRFKKRLIS